MFSSIRVKLTLFYVCVLAIIVGAFALISYSSFVSILRQETDENLAQMAQTLAESIKGEQNDAEVQRGPDELINESLDEFRFRDYQFAVITDDNRLVAFTTENKPPVDLASVDINKFGNVFINDTAFRSHVLPFGIEDPSSSRTSI